MTAEYRQLLRAALDAHARARQQAFIAAGEIGTCSRCGCAADTYEPGCETCWSRRHYRERRRHDPAYTAYLAAYARRKRDARREARQRRERAAYRSPLYGRKAAA